MTYVETIDLMARVLRSQHVDLNDERATFGALVRAGYRAGDVVALGDDAIAEARKQNQEFGELPHA